jgi:hypothetical protein
MLDSITIIAWESVASSAGEQLARNTRVKELVNARRLVVPQWKESQAQIPSMPEKPRGGVWGVVPPRGIGIYYYAAKALT